MIKKVKRKVCRRQMLLVILIAGTFHEKELQETNKK